MLDQALIETFLTEDPAVWKKKLDERIANVAKAAMQLWLKEKTIHLIYMPANGPSWGELAVVPPDMLKAYLRRGWVLADPEPLSKADTFAHIKEIAYGLPLLGIDPDTAAVTLV
jgi:hypothetical protein